MTATIPLAKPYTPGKLVFPVALSRKVDGVPVRIEINSKNGVTTVGFLSRQGEKLWSVEQLVTEFAQAYVGKGFPVPAVFVGEVYQRDNISAPFKDTGGIVRRQYDQSDQLAIALFDTNVGRYGVDLYHINGASPFQYRLETLLFMKQTGVHPWVKPLDQYTVNNQNELEQFWKSFTRGFPQAEGLVARSYSDEWAPGKRTWGYQKLIRDPMIELRIVGFEEGKGKNAGAVGRLIASYKGQEIGIGPGKLSYTERAALWDSWLNGGSRGRIAQIKFKKDESYDALRQPTFQRWRDDKDEPDA